VNLRAQFGRLYRYQSRVYGWFEPLHRRALPSTPTVQLPTERHGEREAGYDVVSGRLSAQSVVVSCGIGCDTTFEESLLRAYGCRIEAFDPTAQAAAYVATRDLPASFTYHKVGLGDSDGEAQFADVQYPTDEYAAVTLMDLKGHHVALQSFAVRRLPTLLDELAIDRIDVLKMDIEGSEFRAWDDVVALSDRIDQIVVEFHPWVLNWASRVPLVLGRRGWKKTRQAIDRIRACGFEIVAVSSRGTEFLFARP
jgi:FkbM family methyltransferase